MFCVYIYNRGFIPLRNYVADVIKIYQFRRAHIESYAPHFADGLTGPGHSNDYSVRVVLWPTACKFRNALLGAQFGGHVPQFVPCFNQLLGSPGLNVYQRVCVAVHSVCLQLVKVTVEMNPCPSSDVTSYYLIRMTQSRHLFFCAILPRDPE